MKEDSPYNKELPEVRLDIREEDIHPEIAERGETVLVLQVNARDDRKNPESPEFGQLIPEAAEKAKSQAKKFFEDVFKGLEETERNKVTILVITSDAELKMPGETNSPHKRAFETGEKVIAGIKEAMSEAEVETQRLLNNSPEIGDKPMTMGSLVDLTMWEESPEFVKFLIEKYGDTKKLWQQYEADVHEKERLEMGAEGPIEIALRTREALTDITQGVAREYHEHHPDQRLYIWVIGQYDNLAPAINGYVYQADPTKLYTPMEKGGGITIRINRDDTKAETTIGGNTFQIPALLQKANEQQDG